MDQLAFFLIVVFISVVVISLLAKLILKRSLKTSFWTGSMQFSASLSLAIFCIFLGVIPAKPAKARASRNPGKHKAPRFHVRGNDGQGHFAFHQIFRDATLTNPCDLTFSR